MHLPSGDKIVETFAKLYLSICGTKSITFCQMFPFPCYCLNIAAYLVPLCKDLKRYKDIYKKDNLQLPCTHPNEIFFLIFCIYSYICCINAFIICCLFCNVKRKKSQKRTFKN